MLHIPLLYEEKNCWNSCQICLKLLPPHIVHNENLSLFFFCGKCILKRKNLVLHSFSHNFFFNLNKSHSNVTQVQWCNKFSIVRTINLYIFSKLLLLLLECHIAIETCCQISSLGNGQYNGHFEDKTVRWSVCGPIVVGLRGPIAETGQRCGTQRTKIALRGVRPYVQSNKIA